SSAALVPPISASTRLTAARRVAWKANPSRSGPVSPWITATGCLSIQRDSSTFTSFTARATASPWRSPAAWSGPLRGATWPSMCGSGGDFVQLTANSTTRNKNPRTPVRGPGDVRSMVELYFNGWINDKPEGLNHFLHWLDLGRRQRATFGLKMGDDVVDQ